MGKIRKEAGIDLQERAGWFEVEEALKKELSRGSSG